MKKNTKKKSLGGRPTVITPEVVAILEEAFANGASDLEACFIANISKDSLYRYQEKCPEFSERKEALKDMLKYQAKKNVACKLKLGDPEMSKWYLERRDKDFKQKTDITSDDKELFKVSDEDLKRQIADKVTSILKS